MQTAPERRRSAQAGVHTMRSNLGPVVDLSSTGMRVLSSRRLRATASVVLTDETGPEFRVRARVAGSKRLGFRKHVAWLEFLDPPPALAEHLTKLGLAD